MKVYIKKIKAAISGTFYLEYDSIFEANRDKYYIEDILKTCGGIKKMKGRKGNFRIKVLRK